MRIFGKLCFAAAALFALASCGPNGAGTSQSVEDFYRGRTIIVMVGTPAGGQYDMGARAVARHLSKYLPGHPAIVVQNMPGGGSLIATSFVFNTAPKDGSVIGTFTDAMLLAPVWKFPGVRFDSRKVNWLGAIGARIASVAFVRSDAPATTIEQMKHKEVTAGSSGPTSPTTTYAYLMNEMLGTKIKMILGYPGDHEVKLAIERGELDGRVAGDWNALKKDHPEWIATKFVVPVAQLTLEPVPGLEGVPRIIDMARNDDDRRIMDVVLGAQRFARVFAAPGEVPPDRVAALRKALEAVTKDPAFIAEIEKTTTIQLRFSDHKALEASIAEAYALPENLRARAARYVGSDG